MISEKKGFFGTFDTVSKSYVIFDALETASVDDRHASVPDANHAPEVSLAKDASARFHERVLHAQIGIEIKSKVSN